MSRPSVLLVGGGLTASLTASLLADTLPQTSLYVWDKARGPGGRMTTSRAPSNPNCTADLGAQYFSPSHSGVKLSPEYESLIQAGILQPLPLNKIQGHRHDTDSLHYTAPQGTSAIVKHFLAKSGAQLTTQKRVTGLEESQGQWRVETDGGNKENFDLVVLTLPVPQILQLGGEIPARLQQQGLLSSLQQIQYSTRFVLGMFYNRAHVPLGVNWAVNYVAEHPVIRYVAIDNEKRGRGDLPTSVMVHSTVAFGGKHMDRTPSDMEETLRQAVRDMFPEWPEPEEVKTLKWLYSQVHEGYPGSPGSLTISSSPPLVMGGDAFTKSNFEGCLESARSIAREVQRFLAKC